MTIQALTSKLSFYLPSEEIKIIERAYRFAEKSHEGQYRQSGEPYVTHPLAVAHILADMHMDHETLIAALLHDVIEDTAATKKQLATQFSTTVAELVDGVSKLTEIEFASKAEQQAENFLKMTLAMSRDIRVVLVKLADRLHNMRTLSVLSPVKRRRIAKETLEIYAPIAQRLGINNFRVEFEDRGFEAMYPLRYSRLQAALKEARRNRKNIVDEIQELIEARLKKAGIEATIIGREKHLWSIYSKMRNKKKSFREIMDVFAFRLVVPTVDECYRVLGLMHNLFKPVPGEFKDYVAIPKANGYQSLHTVLIGLHGVPVEIQIRTPEMDTMADKGIAAHWLYKSGSDQLDKQHSRTNRWIKTLLELQQQAGNPLEFIEHVKTDLFPDEIYVFTPKGEIIQLPHNATAVDFAYAVHTDVGNSCIACQINNQMGSLSAPLNSGERIKIITLPGAQPNPNWLNFVVTAKARSAIRHFLKHQQHGESVELGKRLLDKALQKYDTHYRDLKKSQIKQLLKATNSATFEQVLQDIGLGNRVAFAVANLLVPESQRLVANASDSQQSIVVDTSDGLLIQFARCCHPLPGEAIAGHISPGRGLIVHLQDCKNLVEIRDNPERCMPLTWSSNPQGEFQVHLKVNVENESGLISKVATAITDQNASISEIRTDDKDGKHSTLHLTLGITGRKHLADIIRILKKFPFTHQITRIKNH